MCISDITEIVVPPDDICFKRLSHSGYQQILCFRTKTPGHPYTYKWRGKLDYPGQTTTLPELLATFSHDTASGDRQCAVSGNAFDHSVIGACPQSWRSH